MRYPTRFRPAALLTLPAVLASLAAAAVDRAPFLSPAEALKTFQLEPGLKIELVVAEPLVVEPVAFVFDDQKRLYVVENRGYPGEVKDNSNLADRPVQPEGRVALLEDTDGDGRYDKRTEFATGLTYPNGIALWRGGVIITCAPDVIYLKDTNGDGVADERRVMLTGFETSRTTQLRVSHPVLGLDGKFYLASGLNGGKVTSPEHLDRAPITFTPSDGRFDPDTLVYERIGGRGQFGLTFDSFGHRFVVSNRHPVIGVVLNPWDLNRNPHLPLTEMSQEVSKVEAQARVFPISHTIVTADFMPSLMSKPHAGTFTSACSTLIFDGTGLTPSHAGNVFICEPAQNLVQRQVMRNEGASFRSDLPYENREFLASTDPWFRPVFLANGPEGALYVVDMNRREIDHPQYVPEEARGRLDFVSGKNSGRIYRIVRADKAPALSAAPRATDVTADLVAGLDSAEVWWRSRAHRMLLEKKDPAAAPLLEKLLAANGRPAGRAAALWVLHALNQLPAATLERALRDASAGVREQAVILAGLHPAASLTPRLIEAASDVDAHVRFADALVLGSMTDPAVVPALATIAVRDGADRWTRAAVLSGIGSRMKEFLTALTSARQRRGAAGAEAFSAVAEDLGRTFGAGAPLEACKAFFSQMTSGDPAAFELPAIVGLVEGLRGRTEFKSKSASAIFATFDANAASQVFKAAQSLAVDASAPKRTRSAAVALLGYSGYEQGGEALGALLDARHPPEIQLQAVRALDRMGDPRGAKLMVQPKTWSRYSAQLREAVIASLTAKPAMIEVLFTAIRDGTVKAAEISSLKRTQLQKHADAEIRKSAETLFRELESGDRMKVYHKYREFLAEPGNPDKGAEVFLRVCSACHTHQGKGGKVGPDLTGVRNQPADALLLHILVPNYEVVPAYQTVTVVTDDGRNISGWLAGETDTSIALRTAAGTEENVLRKNITTFTSSGLSLMPDGLEQAMTKEELVSLIAFLKRDPAP